MPLATFPLGPLQTNCYLLHNGDQAVAVDVGGDPAAVTAYLKEHGLHLAAILITHMHFDHLYGVASLISATGAPAYVPEGDAPIRDTEASRGGIWGFPPVPPFDGLPLPHDAVAFGGMACTVLDTPGHTPGGVSFYFPGEGVVFTGDALFYRSVGRTDFPGGSEEVLIDSIRRRLFALPPETKVCPGHGPMTTIGEEKIGNPVCGDFRS